MITIVLPVSRDNFLKQIFQRLDQLECDRENTNLFVYIDGDLNLFEIAQRYVSESRFKERQIKFRRKGLPNVSHITSRRKRIADIHNEIKMIIPECDYVFLLEDDTLIEPDALKKLLADYEKFPEAGFISGVEIGRWGYEHIGAWKMEGDKIYSIENLDLGYLQRVDAAGLYCCLTRYSFYKDGCFMPFEKILGPDFTFGIVLRRAGYQNYVDFSVKCKHLTKRGAIDFENAKIIQVRFEKNDQNEWLLTA